ncbi:MAG: hypothetical protein K2K48_00350 [Anaeroplasmataceae bacterium]|nr:hypothetical protein [Anaeroplasmataceae bacterium]MDE6413847.1 hypothetical protein [Anaeroplasmataceae bacterium]
MKKIIFGLTLTALILLGTIFILSKNKVPVNEDLYYTIPRILTYHYEENKKMCFEIFGNNENTLIEFVEENSYYLVDEKSSYQLNHVEVTKEKDYSSKEATFYKYTISCGLLNISDENIIFEDCSLKIKNESFTLECFIGYLAIYKGEYQELDFQDLYGNYAYIQNELYMVGITIQLAQAYKELMNVSIGPAYVDLMQIEQDQLYDSERLEGSLKHSVISEKKPQDGYKLKAKQNYYFLPISYPNLALFTKGCILLELDGKIYYIEDFTYLANDISISNYNHSKREGKVIYA